MTYILIMTIWGPYGYGTTIHTQEFSSQQLCENAAYKWAQQAPTYESRGKHYYERGTPKALCVPK